MAAEPPRSPAFSQDRAAVQSRLENVRRLVNTSSGARRVAQGQDMKAKKLQEQAASHLAEAEDSFAAGDMEKTSLMLQKATESMFGAIRHIGTGKQGKEKQLRDFEAKAKSVDVLLTAIERVAKEKGGKQAVLEKASKIRKRSVASQGMAKAGKVKEARDQLDQAYEDAKIELERLREGETLVRELNFANKEEEYHYELDRNDTHQMLLKVLLEDKGKSPAARKQIDGFVDQSKTLRKMAEGEAGNGAFDKAVKTLEQSTKHLQRAIRSAGVYIPG